mmetsp:Transcript_35007/g.99228  ORF Transcript_35007/g.99228 Transcript_35007/m.99228 type:complete len:198 (-) Transcript_35007:36-629(-)
MARAPEVPLSQIASPEFQDRLQMLKDCMIEYGGIGIAGPQVGWNVRVFCLALFEPSPRNPKQLNPDTHPFQYWVNPVISEVPGSPRSWFWEGCLSVPGVRGWVERPYECLVEGFDELGERQSVCLDGLLARVFQHEYDHLDGRLFPSRMQDPTLLVPLAAFADQADWAEGWPSEASRACRPGQLRCPTVQQTPGNYE